MGKLPRMRNAQSAKKTRRTVRGSEVFFAVARLSVYSAEKCDSQTLFPRKNAKNMSQGHVAVRNARHGQNDTLALVSKPDLRYDDLKGMMLMTAKENASKSIAGAKTHLFFWYAVVFSVPVFSAAYTLIFGWKAESLTAPLAFLSVFVYFSGERGKHLLAAAAGALTLFLPRILVALWVAL